MKIKSLTIYCSSSNFLNKKYYDISKKIGAFLGEKNIKIIYGGGKAGIMGCISKSAYKNGSKVIGIIPKFLEKKENINYNITKTIIVNEMSRRKKLLFEKSDSILILPGGSGTIEEATEIISWKFLGIHNKPIIIFNYLNYWKELINLYKKSKNHNFGNKNLQSICIIVNNFKEFKEIFK
ncbi:MAG: Cytokinin riboside 5'-monophosphate phosphoribohydrolase [Alphaproteobacteria bacterium MarineAlpha5_Bin9]|nr:MAG: Cytokinin riboside 5'-monophosphate phosphoribohydrolase [Alphaproteobacteria bacterium MarineAlpha5_Bin9]|tara:strand:- start:30869 stop:31408 length:540 start_codon:yes stop_codon:yes gene_type:complete